MSSLFFLNKFVYNISCFFFNEIWCRLVELWYIYKCAYLLSINTNYNLFQVLVSYGVAMLSDCMIELLRFWIQYRAVWEWAYTRSRKLEEFMWYKKKKKSKEKRMSKLLSSFWWFTTLIDWKQRQQLIILTLYHLHRRNSH